jgi:hypothetical protein
MSKHKFQVKRIDESTIIFEGRILKKKCSSCRNIFKTKEYVIKFDSNYYNEGYEKQCKLEYKNWKEIRETEYKKYFVPILQYGISGGIHYVVQPRISLRGRKSDKNFDKIKKEISNKFGLWDICNHNHVINKGNLQIFDYAL